MSIFKGPGEWKLFQNGRVVNEDNDTSDRLRSYFGLILTSENIKKNKEGYEFAIITLWGITITVGNVYNQYISVSYNGNIPDVLDKIEKYSDQFIQVKSAKKV